jgi:hypothetical protein
MDNERFLPGSFHVGSVLVVYVSDWPTRCHVVGDVGHLLRRRRRVRSPPRQRLELLQTVRPWHRSAIGGFWAGAQTVSLI